MLYDTLWQETFADKDVCAHGPGRRRRPLTSRDLGQARSGRGRKGKRMVRPGKLRDQGGRTGRRVGLAGADDAEVAVVRIRVWEARRVGTGRHGERRQRRELRLRGAELELGIVYLAGFVSTTTWSWHIRLGY
jgi:hypothetical protein